MIYRLYNIDIDYTYTVLLAALWYNYWVRNLITTFASQNYFNHDSAYTHVEVTNFLILYIPNIYIVLLDSVVLVNVNITLYIYNNTYSNYCSVCTIYDVQCIMYIVCILYNVHCTLRCTMYNVYCTIYTMYTMHTIYCILCNVRLRLTLDYC